MPDPVIRLRKMAILAAIETVKGTFVVPVAADALEVSNVTITPIEGEEVDYDIVRAHFGSTESVLVTQYRKMAFRVGFAGVGTAGEIPGYSKLLRGCAMSVTNTVGADTVFEPVDDAIESMSIYAVIDRNVYKMPGAAGTCKIEGSAKQLPWMNFEFTGAFVPVETVGAMPATTTTEFQLPLGVNKANTRVRLDGSYWACNAFTVDLGNVVVKQDLTEVDETEITDRKAVGSITIRDTLSSTKDWIGMVNQTVPFELVHGLAATNTVKVEAPLAQIGKPTFGEADGIQMVTLPLRFIPSDAGNDELVITV
ncbi:hypothetical protein [Acidovorax sp.]|uniref:hypothetical protein n=1 Tax=Acidovorax sp. TaxID=1872122 RepID=UPI002ACE9FC1|nr:hypothetical protein [Acidovorax sp.]MDZ7862676.1 hypothetical protein [Acidovorax sp.]